MSKISKLNLTGGTGGKSGTYQYTAPNGVIVTSNNPVYTNNGYYYMENLFSGAQINGASDPFKYWLTSGSTNAGNNNLCFDLSSIASNSILTYIRVYTRGRTDTSTSHRLKYSSDGINWTYASTSYHPCLSIGQYVDHMINKSNIRYVNFDLTMTGSWGFCLDEVEFYYDIDLEKYRINDTTLIFSKIVYVSKSGSDTNIGTKNSPFLTIKKAFDYLNANCRQDSAIVIDDGDYDVQTIHNGSSYNFNAEYNQMRVSIIAKNLGKVKLLNVGEQCIVENNSSYRIKVSYYGIIFQTIRAHSFTLGADDWTNEYYNCVINIAFGGWNGIVSTASAYAENCLFNSSPTIYYTSNPIKGDAINCASVNTSMDPINGTKTTCLYNVKIDSIYNITSDGWKNTGTDVINSSFKTNIGVYGGRFSWLAYGRYLTVIDNRISYKDNSMIVPINKIESQLTIDDFHDYGMTEEEWGGGGHPRILFCCR